MNKELCPECNQYVDGEEMVDTSGKLTYFAYVCRECYGELESDG